MIPLWTETKCLPQMQSFPPGALGCGQMLSQAELRVLCPSSDGVLFLTPRRDPAESMEKPLVIAGLRVRMEQSMFLTCLSPV